MSVSTKNATENSLLQSKRIIFAGTPDFAAVHLKALLDAGIRPLAVYTQPDRPAGRGHKLCPSDVKKLALEAGLEVYTPVNFKNEEDIKAFEELNADLCIVVAYGIILPQRIIDAAKFGFINVHGSILPKYRGAAPIQRALLDGESQTGVSIMKVALKLDAGDVYSVATTPIESTDTSGTLFDRLALLGADTLLKTIPSIFDGSAGRSSNSVDGHRGIGIGMSICKTIIEAHNGTLMVISHENGAEFIFKLPKSKENEF